MTIPLNESSKVNLFPSTLPLLIGMGSPCPTSTEPVSVLPSCLKVNVSGKLVPSGAFASPVQVPVTSAAIAVAALNVIANAAHTQINFLIGFIISPSSQPSPRPTHHTARH